MKKGWNRYRLFGSSDIIKVDFERSKKPRPLSCSQIVRSSQFLLTELSVKYNPLTKTVKLNGLTIDMAYRTPEAIRKAKQVLKKVEEDAQAKGVKRIITAPTIVTPRTAGKLGYVLLKTKVVHGVKLYIYGKNF